MQNTQNAVSQEKLMEMYISMLTIRLFEETVASLDEAKQITTPCHLYIGQEAIASGICAALKKTDYIWGGHRSHGHYLAKGGDIKKIMAEIFCKETGCSKGRGGSMHIIAKEVGLLGTVPLVAATIPLAVGTGFASKLRNDKKVSVAFFGDGATEEGHFHESVNLAALYKLPVIFVCENNFYASHMDLLSRRAADNIDKAAIAHGLPSKKIDGNNINIVYSAAKEAVEHARNGNGPTLLECRTYRWRGHVGPSWDTDVGVKRKDELKDWLPKDPIVQSCHKLLNMGVLESKLNQVKVDIEKVIEDAVTFAQQSAPPKKEDILQHVFYTKNKGVR